MIDLAQATIDVCSWFLAPFAILCVLSWVISFFRR